MPEAKPVAGQPVVRFLFLEGKMSRDQRKISWAVVGALGCLALFLCAVLAGAGGYIFYDVDPFKLQNAAATPTARPTKSVIDIPKDQAACEAQGGKWGRIGLAPREECNLPTTDAGKVCSDSSECEGMCVANLSREDYDRVTKNRVVIDAKGKCTPWRIVVGCLAIVTDGKVNGILCID
jgi:hypothetical protein